MISQRYSNPTALTVGKQGGIFGHRGTVIGRTVLKSKDGYCWNEYHLKLDDGSTTTLVYESGIWKRFDLFDPDPALSAADAADCDVGDTVTLRSRSVDISYVGQSKILHIEGEAPEGYRVGSEAHYFNAEAMNHLYVVSWTGSEVEYYEGQTLPRGEVESAFGLPEQSLLNRIFSGGSGGLDGWFDSGHRLSAIVLFAVCSFIFVCGLGSMSSSPTSDPPVLVQAPAIHFPIKAEGDLEGHHYIIAGHQLSEVAEMRGRFGRHEYDLIDEQGEHALLIQGLAWGARQWYLFGPVSDAARLWPNLAATFRAGSTFKIEDEPAFVRTLFVCRTTSWDGDPPPGVHAGSVRFGFTAQTKDGWVLARWNDTDIEVRSGRILADREVKGAFGPGYSN